MYKHKAKLLGPEHYIHSGSFGHMVISSTSDPSCCSSLPHVSSSSAMGAQRN